MPTDIWTCATSSRSPPDAGLLRERIGFAAGRQMELEVGAVTGAAYGEKDVGRWMQRNGYRE